MTHHVPSIQSNLDGKRWDLVSLAFAPNLDELILEYQRRVWIHGHTHERFDYRIGKTRMGGATGLRDSTANLATVGQGTDEVDDQLGAC